MKAAGIFANTGRKLERFAVAVCAVALMCATAHGADDAVAKARTTFVDKMVTTHGFERKELTELLNGAAINQTILDAMAKPAERVMPWFEYRNIFMTEARIAGGAQFWQEHAAVLDTMSQRYGVAPEMIVAIVGVETFFGRRTGSYRVIDALSTLAFAYPPRSAFFTGELEQFLLLCREEHVDVAKVQGSYAGAMGAGQFIPSSYRNYAVDGDADGKRDLLGDWDDVLGSVANYFKESGWQTGRPVAEQATKSERWVGKEPPDKLDLNATVGALSRAGYVFPTDLPAEEPAGVLALEAQGGGSEYWVGFNNFRVITRYNRSPKYALAAYQLSQAIRARYMNLAASTAGGAAE